MNYKCLNIRETENGIIKEFIQKDTNDLPEGEVLINVKYSCLNFKDALSASGNKGVTRKYPHTPGVDASGIVAESKSAKFKEGDEVIVTGFDLGMNTAGGLAEYIRVPELWVVSKPENLTLQEAMQYGTAGFTAALAVNKMLRNLQNPNQGDILITGATGGVGSIAVMILSQLGFTVVAASGKKSQNQSLLDIGASKVIAREEVLEDEKKMLVKPRWAGAVDNLGGDYLASILKSCFKEANVTSIGLVSSFKLNTTVMPFILNGVNLMGINSADCPVGLRHDIWKRLSGEWKLKNLEKIVTLIKLEDSIQYLEDMLVAKTSGRIVIKI